MDMIKKNAETLKILGGVAVGLIIIAFMEGSLSGMLLAILLIFRPQWVSTYNEEAYMSR